MTYPRSDHIACYECETDAAIYHCHGCSELYCSRHQATHFRGRHADQGTLYEVYEQVEAVLSTVEDESPRMHYYDSLARWVGITMPDDTGSVQPSLWGYSRVADLLADNSGPEEQYPSLVSFIGPTGSGKSTLIRSFIRFTCRDVPTAGMEPITSSVDAAHR